MFVGADTIWFPTGESGNGSIDAVVAGGAGGRRSVLVVHQKEGAASYDLGQLVPGIAGLQTVLKIDDGSPNRIVSTNYDGQLHFEGFGVAAVTTAMPDGALQP
jgi:hypothetical protein